MGASTRNSHLPPDRIFVHLPIPGKSNAASARDGEDGASACSSSSTRAAAAAPAYYTRMVEVGRDNLYATTFSQLKRNFLQDVGVVYPEVVRGDTKYQFYTAATDAPVPDVSCLGLYCPLGNCAVPETDYGHHSFVHQDFVLKPVAASGLSKGELSYYYAHSSSNSGTASRAGGASAPARQPMDGGKAAIAHNKRQSPFGTNIELYETITKYSFEDHNTTTVKVFLPLEGVGKIDHKNVESRFGERSFEVLIHDYKGKNWRLGCAKTHEGILPEKSRHVVRDNKITLMLHKATDGAIWFDLFKKKAIGDDEKP
eukprot:g17105.t1